LREFSTDFSLKSGESIVSEIEWQYFRQTLCCDNFVLAKKSLVKLTPCEVTNATKKQQFFVLTFL